MKTSLRIGLIQPVIDPNSAWGTDKPFSINIDSVTAERVWSEIKLGLMLMLKDSIVPDIIVIPELHLPIFKIQKIEQISKKYGVIIVSGVDFQKNPIHKEKIRNRGIICIPNRLGKKGKSTKVNTINFGKSYFTYMERSMFKGRWVEDPEQNMYIITSSKLGNFGLSICSDIFDIERMMLYQGRIHHLIIISLNKDLNTYFSLAESLTRLIYCNVIICNTGQYGGSIVVSPLDDPNERLIYKYQGQKMFNTHVVEIPVKPLEDAQGFDFVINNKNSMGIKFKATPPGYPRQPK